MKKKKPVIHHDKRGEFRWETYLVGGKQKKRKVRMVCGIDKDEFIESHADDVFLQHNGYYEILHAREEKKSKDQTAAKALTLIPFLDPKPQQYTSQSRQPE